jgi:hypothetical protein
MSGKQRNLNRAHSKDIKKVEKKVQKCTRFFRTSSQKINIRSLDSESVRTAV